MARKPKKLSQIELDNHFKVFKSALETKIASYKVPKDTDSLVLQKKQFNQMFALEKQFRNELVNHRFGEFAFSAFINYIIETKRNILSARPYFRERHTTFTAKISRAFKTRNHKLLYKFKYNYRFISYVMSLRDWSQDSSLVQIYKQVQSIRDEICTMNLPLAISRAHLFYKKTPKGSHLTYMDMVQIAGIGLGQGVDKFVPPFSRTWRAVAIGRIIGDLILAYSGTTIHLYPRSKRLLYKANKLLGRGEVESGDFITLAKKISADPDPQLQTTPIELSELLSATTSAVSDDTPIGGEEGEDQLRLIDQFEAPPEIFRPDIQVEYEEQSETLKLAMTFLPLLEVKLLKLKGV